MPIDREVVQSAVPAGVAVGDVLSARTDGLYGVVFEAWDQRVDPPARRVLRVFDKRAAAQLGERLTGRLSGLAQGPLPHVLPVSEAAEDFAWLLTPRCDGLVSDQLPVPDEANTREIIESLLEALAGLHERRLAHGDVRPRNIGVVRGHNGSGWYFLLDAAIGPVAHWTDGQRLDEAQAGYLPPEAGGVVGGVLSLAADVYAAGLTWAECLGLWTPSMGAPDVHSWRGRVGRPERHLLRSMLHADPERRPKARQALSALRAMRGAQSTRFWRSAALTVSALLIVAAGFGAGARSRLANKLADLEREITVLRHQVDNPDSPTPPPSGPDEPRTGAEKKALDHLKLWHRTQMKASDLGQFVAALPDGECKRILAQWRETAFTTDSWSLEISVKSWTSPVPDDLYLTMYVGDTVVIDEAKGPPPTIKIKIKWKPDQPIQIWLEQPAWWSVDALDVYDSGEIDGPLALYWLQRSGWISDRKLGPLQVCVRIVDPAPPEIPPSSQPN